MGRKQTKTKTPKPKRRSDRKRKRTTKGEYYDQNFDDCTSNQVDSPPAPDKSVSFAVEKGTLSPPTKLLRRSEIPILQDIATPVFQTSISNDENVDDATPTKLTFRTRDRAESTPSSVFCANRTFPVANGCITGKTAGLVTPVRAVRRTKSLNLDEELELPVVNGCITGKTAGLVTPGRAVRRTKSLNLEEELELAEIFRLANEGGENDISELEELQEEEQEDNDKLEWTDDHHSWKILANVYELLHYPNSTQQSGTEIAELEKTISQHAERINELMHEREVQDLQIESLNKRLFHKDQQLKVHSDRIKQLQDSNNYRNEVVRLEGIVETNELELRAVKEDLSTKVNKIQILEEKLKDKKELETTTFQEQTEKIKILEVQLENLQEMEENLKSKEDENQQMEEILKQNVIEMKKTGRRT